ncbi:MAG: hypothetical protein JNL39_16880, partial [Opitutaceae bacterium]|nr:hypothetical protein [Opitutaceae bacterium]
MIPASPRRVALLLASLILVAPGVAAPAAKPFDDPAARAALPEFNVIPAALPHELTPAAPVDSAQFSRWSRSQGDNGSRRYSALTQINRTNVHRLEEAWLYRSGDGARNTQCTP